MSIKTSWNVFNNSGITVLDRESPISKDVSFHINLFLYFRLERKKKKSKMKVKWGFQVSMLFLPRYVIIIRKYLISN